MSNRKANQTLKTVKHMQCCFLCGGNRDIEGSHVIHKLDISFTTQTSPSDAVRIVELNTNWMKDPKWARPYEIHGSMNLIWFCHTRKLAFDRHEFCVKTDLNGNVLCHAFDAALETWSQKPTQRCWINMNPTSLWTTFQGEQWQCESCRLNFAGTDTLTTRNPRAGKQLWKSVSEKGADDDDNEADGDGDS